MIQYNNQNAILCSLHENKDRYVASRVISELFRPYQVTVTGTGLTCPVDLTGTVDCGDKVGKFNVEVKSRRKSPEKLAKYPNYELRVDKLERMMSVTPTDTLGLYMVLLNEEKAIVYNLKLIDWNTVNVFNWRIKEVQVDPNSSYRYYPTYSLPENLSVATVDIKDYITDYYKQKIA